MLATTVWLFGYDELMWQKATPDCGITKSEPGYIKGFSRKFWQGDETHVGTPGKPGRVPTLVRSEDPQEKCWGVAHELVPGTEGKTREYLGLKEKVGYKKVGVTLHREGELPIDIEIFIYTEENPLWLGPADVKSIAKQISESEGPREKNITYFSQLFDTYTARCASSGKDNHLTELYVELKKLVK